MPINTSAILSSVSQGGLPTNQIVQQLVRVQEQQSIRPLQQEKQQLSEQVSHIQSVKEKFDALGEQLDKLDTGKELRARNVTSSDEDVATATVDGNASPSSYSLDVSQLAQAEKDISNGFTDSSAEVKAGDLNLTVNEGSADSESFTVSVAAGDTLADVRDKINNSNASDQISASIIDDGTDSHLKIQRDEKGHANGSSASQALTLNHNATGGSGTALSFTEQQAGKNASFTLDGQTITRQSNRITDVVDGVDFNLESTGQTNVEIAVDNEKILNNVEKFTKAFNKVVDKINEESEASSFAKRQASSRLRSVISSKVDGLGEVTNLSSIGITTDFETGQLNFDRGKAKEVLNKSPKNFEKLFTDENNGVAVRMKEAVDQMTDSDGLFEAQLEGIRDQKELVTDDIADEREQVNAYEERVKDRFAGLKTMRAKMQRNFSSLLGG